MRDDKVPPNADSYGYRVLGWCKEAMQESDEFLRSQIGYKKCDESINQIMSIEDNLRTTALSSTTINQSAQAFFDMCAGLTDIKPFWEYRTYNKRYESHTSIYGKLSQHVWMQRAMDMSFYYGVQYALSCGTTYCQPYWDSQVQDLKMESWDPRDVLPIRPTTGPSIQESYGVISRKARS